MNGRDESGDGTRLERRSGSPLQVVTFDVANERYAVDILSVQEINRLMTVTRVPGSPPGLEGVINLRGRIIPVMDLRIRFGHDRGEAKDENRIVVVEVHGRTIGFIVDRVHKVLRIDGRIIDAPPDLVCPIDSDIVAGVGHLEDRLLILLDLGRLFPSGMDALAVDTAV